MYDCIIIGAGVSGSATARELSRYDLSVAVLEKEEDVGCGTSKANSGIAHAGFDAKPGTLMAKLNVEGSEMMEELSKELDFPYRRIGALVLMFDEADRDRLNELYDRGVANGVKDLKIVERDELEKLEPNVGKDAVAALFAPTSAVICPFGMNIALAENAAVNGAEFFFDQEVKRIEREDDHWKIITGCAVFEAKCVVNAAGVYSGMLHNMVSSKKLEIIPRRGSYYLLDKAVGSYVDHTVFQLPGKFGKGVLVTPTAHGNILVGPTAVDVDDPEGTNTTADELADIAVKASKSIEGLPLNQVITSFAGLRAHDAGHDFIIGEAEDAKGFVDCAGIESPGLTSAPAIGKMTAGIVAKLLNAKLKDNFISKREGILNPSKLSIEERNGLIARKPEYGRIVCRCESITEGEIIDALTRPVPAASLDGVKRRTRAGMGRCQSGFCSPKTMEIISKVKGIPFEEVTKKGKDSKIIVGTDKDSL